MYMTYIVTTCMNVFDFSISMRGSGGGQYSNSLNPIVKLPEKNLGPPSLPPTNKITYMYASTSNTHPNPRKIFLDPRMISAT